MSRLHVWIVILVLAMAVSVVPAGSKGGKTKDLEEQIAELRAALEQQQAAYEQLLAEQFAQLSGKLDQRFAALEQKIAEANQSEAQKNEMAGRILGDVNRLVASGDYEGAKAKMTELQSKYGATQTARRARSIQQELAVFGKSAPESLGIEKWYQGETSLQEGNATLLVFWEEWCPHCKREVPKIEQLYSKYKDQGLQVVGLTKITRSSTEEKVQDFLKQQKVSYPVAKENGQTSAYFNVSGIPAAAVVKDGKVVWRGHPGRLTEAMLQGWL